MNHIINKPTFVTCIISFSICLQFRVNSEDIKSQLKPAKSVYSHFEVSSLFSLNTKNLCTLVFLATLFCFHY